MISRKEIFVILIPGFPESENDTTCLPLQQAFVKSLHKQNPQLEIVVLSFQYPYHTKKYNWFTIPVIPFAGKNKGGLSRFIRRENIIRVLNEINSTNKIIGLLSFWCTECAWVGKRFAAKNKLKHIIWIRGQDAREANYYVKKINPVPDELAALSDFLQDEFEKNHSIRPAYVIPPGIDSTEFSENNLSRDIDILGAGSLISLKQFSIFLEIVYEIKKEFPLIKAVLCGKGAEEERLKRLLGKYGLQTNVVFTGELSHPELLSYMQKVKIFLHPSSYEGFSGVCLEAVYAGAHVISFCKPMHEPISQWHIVNDKEEMKSKVKEIYKNKTIQYNCINKYSADESAKKLMELFSG